MPRLTLPISVIIPTKFRPTEMEVTIATVLQQTDTPAQVIVVDQSDGQEIRQRVEGQFASAPAAIREKTALCYIHDGGIAGAAAARNRGIEAASGGILLFLDDDVRLESDFLEQISETYRRYPEAAGVSGVFTNYSRPSAWFRLWSRLFVGGPFHDERQPIYWSAERLRHADPIRVRKFTGALMSFKAEAIQHARFDERVRRTSAEDLDFCLQLEGGSVLLVNPRARLEHRHGAEGRSREHWIYTDVERASYVFWKHWRRNSTNWLWFGWMLSGYALAGLIHALRRSSLTAWRGIVRGVADGVSEARAAAAGESSRARCAGDRHC